MKYTCVIDNVKSFEWGLNVQEAYLFSWIYNAPSWADKVIIGNDVYYFVSKKKAIEDYPLLTTKPDTIYRYYKFFVEKGLILLKKIDGKDYISLTEKAKTYGNKSERSENNPSEVGNKSEFKSENNPTYYNNSFISELDSSILKNSKNEFSDSGKKIFSVDEKVNITHPLPPPPPIENLFSAWWGIWPKKVGKDKAEAKFKIFKFEEQQKIIAHSMEYAKVLNHKRFCCDPNKYLSSKFWKDADFIESRDFRSDKFKGNDFDYENSTGGF